MQRESRLGRALWLVLLALVGGYVLTGFVRSPFSAPPGAAAVRQTAVTIWAPSGESGDEGSAVLDFAARRLEADGHPTAVRTVPGGPAAALISFLSADGRGRGRMMAVTSTTIADLAHDRREALVPGMAEEAALAWALLRRARPVATLAEAPLELAVSGDSAVRSGAALLESMTEAPAAQLFAVDDDVFSRDRLAALVDGAEVDGEVRFSTFQSADAAVRAVESGSARTILSGRPTLRPAIRAGELRGLGWPLPGARPRSWVALVAPPDVGRTELLRLRAWVARLRRERSWRRRLRSEGRLPGPRGAGADSLLRRYASADRIERTAERVEDG